MIKDKGTNRRTPIRVIIDAVTGWVRVRLSDADGNYMPSGDAAARPVYTTGVVTANALPTGAATAAKQLAAAHTVTPVDSVPTSANHNNPSAALTWTNGELTTIVLTIGVATYTKTITWTAGEITAISSWS